MKKKTIELLGIKITVERNRKEKERITLSDNDLANRAMDKYLGGTTTISGLCGDVVTCRIIGFKELRSDIDGRVALFYTDNTDYDLVYWKEYQIMEGYEKEKSIFSKLLGGF